MHSPYSRGGGGGSGYGSGYGGGGHGGGPPVHPRLEDIPYCKRHLDASRGAAKRAVAADQRGRPDEAVRAYTEAITGLMTVLSLPYHRALDEGGQLQRKLEAYMTRAEQLKHDMSHRMSSSPSATTTTTATTTPQQHHQQQQRHQQQQQHSHHPQREQPSCFSCGYTSLAAMGGAVVEMGPKMMNVGHVVQPGSPSYPLVHCMMTGMAHTALYHMAATRGSPHAEEPRGDALPPCNYHELALVPPKLHSFTRHAGPGAPPASEPGHGSPVSRYGFSFVDHAPELFLRLRLRAGVSNAAYVASLGCVGAKQRSLLELVSPGKSGSFLYYSQDLKFVIKTVTEEEYGLLTGCLAEYAFHMESSWNKSLLCRFFGFYSVHVLDTGGDPSQASSAAPTPSLSPTRRTHFVVMENVFPPAVALDAVYDLKGSTHNRSVTKDEPGDPADDSLVIQKDLDFSGRIRLPSNMRTALLQYLEWDCEWLERRGVMDYSFLVGRVKACDAPATAQRILSAPGEHVLRQARGGIAGSDGYVYYVAIIDFLQPFNLRKQMEYTLKSYWWGDVTVSVNPPDKYASRLQQFVRRIVVA